MEFAALLTPLLYIYVRVLFVGSHTITNQLNKLA